MEMKKITIKKAYIAVHSFLYDNYYKNYEDGLKKEEMIFMLGDMELLPDGDSLDPMCWSVWQEFCNGSADDLITKEVSYLAMITFLYCFISTWNDSKGKDVFLDLIHELRKKREEIEKLFETYIQ